MLAYEMACKSDAVILENAPIAFVCCMPRCPLYTNSMQTVGVGDMEAGQDAGGMVQAEPAGETDPDGRRMVLDWKGDPMYINPGDKMPM